MGVKIRKLLITTFFLVICCSISLGATHNRGWSTPKTLFGPSHLYSISSPVFDSNNVWHMAYSGHILNYPYAFLSYMNGKGSKYDIKSGRDNENYVYDVNIAVDSNDNLHAIYLNLGYVNYMYANNVLGYWSDPKELTGLIESPYISFSAPSFVFDSNNVLHMVYSWYGDPNCHLTYANSNGAKYDIMEWTLTAPSFCSLAGTSFQSLSI